MSATPIVKLEQIARVYGTEQNPLTVLRDVNLQVDDGEYVAIVGPSGAGKSTMLNILGCLDRPTRGAYFFMGDNVAELDDEALSRVRKHHLGFVFQSFQLVSHLSILENVEMPLMYAREPRGKRRQRCMELLERVGLKERVHHIPSELSGGECQRAAIARALANNPAMILADEPTGNLDSVTSADIMALLNELHDSGRTILLITHDTGVAEAAPRRVHLRDGRIETDTRLEVAADVSA